MSYSVEIDNIPHDVWDDYARDFLDHTIYQTWAYQHARALKENQELNRIIIRNSKNNIVLMCIVRIKRISPLGLRIGYVQWGPLIRHRNQHGCLCEEVWRRLLCSYIPKKVDVLRIVPNMVDDEKGKKIANVICMGGFEKVTGSNRYHSIYVPVCDGEKAIRRGLHRSWLRGLKKAEQNDIEIREGNNLTYFDILEDIYESTKERKKFQGLDPQLFIEVQKKLQHEDKMHIVVAYSSGKPVTAHASSYLGEMGEGILAGSTEEGLRLNSSYLVWWRTLVAAYQAGMKVYNLGGIDPKKNPTVCQFKSRMGGQKVYHIGTFDAVRSPSAKMLWRGIERMYRLFHN
jgi:lipid II:glycine glycyltransferase (peptidoglycan interpeptide bridge formation enzyme)